MSDADPLSSQQFQETLWDGIMSCVTRSLQVKSGRPGESSGDTRQQGSHDNNGIWRTIHWTRTAPETIAR